MPEERNLSSLEYAQILADIKRDIQMAQVKSMVALFIVLIQKSRKMRDN